MKSHPTPLVVDVDGTFLSTDMMIESFWQALGRQPIETLRVSLKYLTRRAYLKRKLAQLADLRVDLLPVNYLVNNYVRQSKSEGRPVVFASGSDISLVQSLADHHGITEPVFASDGATNLTGSRKAKVLCETYGENGFDYVGDSAVDRAVWERAENAIIVGSFPKISHDLAREGKSVSNFRNDWNLRDLLVGLRPHQWVKNVLLLMPLIAAHQFGMASITAVGMAIIAFCAAASSIYLVNDLLDLEADRLHPTKCKRPFAAGSVPLFAGMASFVVLGVFALALAAQLGWPVFAIISLYMMLSLAYSLKLKRMRWVDIATLASLYTIRVVAGALAADVAASGWLIAFIFPTFITLGCVKRLTELTLAKSDERLPGRGYGRPDRGDLLNVAGLGMLGSLLVFLLYSFSQTAQLLYPNTWVLWLALVPIAAWQFRMVWLGWAGKQDYDPLVFAMRDRYGLSILIVTLIVLFSAAGLI